VDHQDPQATFDLIKSLPKTVEEMAKFQELTKQRDYLAQDKVRNNLTPEQYKNALQELDQKGKQLVREIQGLNNNGADPENKSVQKLAIDSPDTSP